MRDWVGPARRPFPLTAPLLRRVGSRARRLDSPSGPGIVNIVSLSTHSHRRADPYRKSWLNRHGNPSEKGVIAFSSG
jgi:hypothetical protein